MKWPFGRAKRTAIEILKGAEWTCGTCSDRHLGMFDLACHHPDPWTGSSEYEPNSALDRERDFLSEDFCVLGGEHFLVRCVLEIPVHGLEEKFGFGCWGSLKRDNFEIYVAHFDDGTGSGRSPVGKLVVQFAASVRQRHADRVPDVPTTRPPEAGVTGSGR